ncbi:MAG: hypothetical protein GEV06_02335 [Luteitalea sp.]|nr:hypothetical protein [Luteitalea sp.]
MHRLTLTALALGVGAVAPLMAQQPPIALIGVHVVGMEDENVANSQTILVRDGRIAEIGPAASVKIPEGARGVAR